MTATRSARVQTPLGEGTLLFLSMMAREALGRPFAFTVELLAETDTLDLSSLLGQVMTVELELQQNATREFSGYCTEIALVGAHGRYVRYRAQLAPWFSLLSHTTTSRIFQKMSVPDVIKQIFRDRGFSDFKEALTGQYRIWDYLVQYRESDFNFVSRLMEQEGIYYYFTHQDKKHTLILSDSYSSHQKVPGYEELPYFPPQQGEQRERDHINSWQALRKIRPGAFVATDFDFEKPKLKLSSQLRKPNEHSQADYELYDYPGEFHDLAEADVQVRLRLEEHQTEYEVLRASSNARGLHTGALFNLVDFPREDQNKEYLVTEAHYELRVNDYESIGSGSSGPNYSLQFHAIDSQRPFRAARVTRKPVVEGPQTAIVVGDPKQEIWTDKYGRIKVRFHWDRRDSASDDERSCWVRVAQIWAGSGFGGIHIPRVGQEVVVDFLEGDPDRPLVTGCLYNADNMPPYTLPANQTQSGIKSRSVAGATPDNFNEIRFEDKKGAEELHIQAEKDMSTLVKHDQTTTIQHDRTTSITRNDTLNITGDQFIHIHGNLSMTVDGVTEPKNPEKASPIKSKMAVTGSHDMKASDKISMAAPNMITLTVGGSSITITPGSITISAGGSTIVVDANVALGSSGKSNIVLDANAFAKASGGGSMLLDGNACVQSSGKSQMLLDGDAALTTGGTVSLHGAKITGKGDTEAGLDGGGSVIALSPASADLSGAQVNVTGKGVVSVGGPMVKIG
ncbi:MAG TPA: type VI secretion system tip protein TssI/VgrG [Polyangiaceae bacterium]|nr:type VI secretion system tip protein TssI/VgrG [Polyangiaceae bacterium]